MSKFEIKVEDFVSFINSLGYKVGDVRWSREFGPLTEKILNSGYEFKIKIYNEHIENIIQVDVKPTSLYINNKTSFENTNKLLSKWRKHLYNIYGQEYYDYLKNYCEKNKNFDRQLHEQLLKEIDYKIAKLIEEKNIRIAKIKETNEKYDAILNDLEETLEM